MNGNYSDNTLIRQSNILDKLMKLFNDFLKERQNVKNLDSCIRQ